MKMSKSSQTEATEFELTPEQRIKALESEVNFWKTRHGLLLRNSPNVSVIDEFLESTDPDSGMLYPTDLKEAIIGTVEHISLGEVILLDKDKCLEIFARDMSMEDAIEHFHFNTLGSYVEGVPAYATFIN